MTSRVSALALSLAMFATSALAWSPRPDDLQWARHAFEHRCAEVRVRNASVTVRCAPDGSVGSVETPVDLSIARSLSATLRWTWTSSAPNARGSTAVHSVDDFVVVEQTSCPDCRRVMGRTWLFRPASAPDAVLRAAQTAAGLSPSALLRSVQAWRDARPTAGTTTPAATRP